MAPKKTPARAQAAKDDAAPAKESKLEEVEQAVVAEAKKVTKEAEAKVEELAQSPFVKELENLSVEALRQLHDDAIIAEDAAKRELAVARQRAANLASSVDATVDHEIIVLKQKIQDAEVRIKQIENKLSGELKDIWGTTF